MGKIIKHKSFVFKTNKANNHLIYYLAFIIFVASFLLYLNTLSNKYALDDFSVIKDNWVVKNGVQSIPLIFKTSYRFGYWNSIENLYRPLTLALFATLWQISPDNPSFYHLINILLYALTGFLLFITLCRILNKVNIIILFISCLLFIFHPIHTEVVANIKSCDEILSFLFILLTINYLWKFIEKKSYLSIILSLIFYFLAFLSKESAITMLGVIPLMIYFFTDLPLSKNIKLSLLFVVPALIFLAIRRIVLGFMLDLIINPVIDNLLVACPNFYYQTATAIKILGIYLLKIIYPNPLVVDYSYNQITIVNWCNLQAIFSLLTYLFFGIYAIYFFKRKSIISFFILFYIITMSIYSNIFMIIGSSFGERFLYVPVLAFCVILTFLLSKLLKVDVWDNKKSEFRIFIMKNKVIILIILPVLIAYSIKTISRSSEWKNNWTLFSADIKNSPNSAHMRYYYGLVLEQDKIINVSDPVEKNKYIDLAIDEFKTAIKIYPKYADAYDQLGLAYSKKGDNINAIRNYDLALQLNSSKFITYSNMGAIYFDTGDYQTALELYQKSIYYNSRFSEGYLNLGSTYGALGKYDLAINSFLKCLEFHPDNPLVYHLLGVTYQKIGDHVNENKYLSIEHKLDTTIKN